MKTSAAPLSPLDRQTLLHLARASIRSALGVGPPLSPPADGATLHQPGAAFVTLYRQRALRGCIGTTSWEQPLHVAVTRVARAAALDDPRFPPVRLDELAELTIDISRLTPLQPATAEQIDIGVHGVCIEGHAVRALFLPKVAVEHGWDTTTLLGRLCEKAMLAEHAWRDPAMRLFTFEAEVFSEAGAGG